MSALIRLARDVATVAFVVALFLFAHTFLVEAFRIPTGSMEGTLLVGDFLLVNKTLYGADIPGGKRVPAIAHPDRNDVIVFVPPHEPDRSYVKRVVGVPGDTLAMRDKVLYLNGRPREEAWALHIDHETDPFDPDMLWQRAYVVEAGERYRPTRDNWGPIVVPSANYFVLGDNRDDSLDSRYWGFVPGDAVRGRPLMVYFSLDRRHGERGLGAIRWGRIGEAIR
ncbi:MAG TPA: signal peptidase I [Longimicrobiales bacterium]|nr:signal peptidase I [Longimicrobiales bacterium]